MYSCLDWSVLTTLNCRNMALSVLNNKNKKKKRKQEMYIYTPTHTCMHVRWALERLRQIWHFTMFTLLTLVSHFVTEVSWWSSMCNQGEYRPSSARRRGWPETRAEPYWQSRCECRKQSSFRRPIPCLFRCRGPGHFGSSSTISRYAPTSLPNRHGACARRWPFRVCNNYC